MFIKRIDGAEHNRSGFYYEIDLHSQPLGEGGMGVVYKGFSVCKTTGNRQVVAIKMLRDDLNEEVYERAFREASIRLKNDNLVEMMDFVKVVERDAFGTPVQRYYVVSEYLNGVILSDLLMGRFKDNDGIEMKFAKKLYLEYISDRNSTSAKIIKSVLSGILALHDNGYIHRDIDPTNIMVTDKGDIKLIDFGIAKNLKSLGTADNMQEAGKFIGKAEYAAPELVRGEVMNHCYQTDIYAIGILFYRLLVGEMPFKGTTFEIILHQQKTKVPVHKVKHPGYASIIKKATQKKISARYSSVVEMRLDVDRARPNPNPIIEFLRKYWKEASIAITASAACLIIINYTNSGQEQKIVVPPQPPVHQMDNHRVAFDNALASLNSKNEDSVRIGWEQMRNLARNNYDMALLELGRTYCPYSKVQTQSIKNRRNILGLNNSSQEKTQYDLTVGYLTNKQPIDSLDIYSLYILGYSYWINSEWKKGEQTLSKALSKINLFDEKSIAGSSKEKMTAEIDKYLKECKKQSDRDL